ncbi:MAG: zinc ribbon domain-containing protein [Gemmatimonadota bacterium]
MSEQVLERFHRALIEEIQTQRPEYLTSPFTVAEIYQNLVPYGSHRDRIGVEMNGDYEDALIRLLAGEGGYLILDSEHALKDLRAELEAPNPNTGLYREFAAIDVRLNQAYLDLAASAMDQLPDLASQLDAEEPVGMSDLAPGSVTPATPEDIGIVPPGADIFDQGNGTGTDRPPTFLPEVEESTRPRLEPEFVDDEPETDEVVHTPPPAVALSSSVSNAESGEWKPGAAGGRCSWCSEQLPSRDGLNFCPFCGTDLNLVPCASCGSAIEPGWSYCITCGDAVGA